MIKFFVMFTIIYHTTNNNQSLTFSNLCIQIWTKPLHVSWLKAELTSCACETLCFKRHLSPEKFFFNQNLFKVKVIDLSVFGKGIMSRVWMLNAKC